MGRFAYDPKGRRVEKVVGGVTTNYTYDREDILREVRGTATLRYVHGPEVDEPLAVEDAAVSYLHADALGSVVAATNAAGSVVSTRGYDAWGEPQTGTSEAGYAFTGREWDPETELYFHRARYYEAGLGRFISEDPIGLGGGINRYAYVDAAPTTWIDPSGTSRGRTLECGPCTFAFDNDPVKGPHVHWWCPGQPQQGCAYPDGSSCDNSGPPPSRIKDCVRKLKPDWFPCVNTPPPAASPECGPACIITIIIILFMTRGAGGMRAQPAGGMMAPGGGVPPDA